ncbi:MAG: acetylglutamate kinase [Flavobacteriaceae bacterium]|jgi:acetylglutamate kinase|nr:acetylglutamate kinase [Flavobacteriaceae bacterium]
MAELKIYKIGGGIIDDDTHLSDFLQDFSQIRSKKILIHGGGKGASALLKKLGIEPKMIDGRRITDKPTLDVVTALYAGLLNKKIVSLLQKYDENAIGLSGADGNLIQAVQRPVKEIDYGFVGDVEKKNINISLLDLLLKNGYTPVLCAITHDKNGQLLNTNADTIASTVAEAAADFYDTELHFCFDKIGVLRDINDENSLIPRINHSDYETLKVEKIVADGMIPKLDNAFRVICSGVKKVVLEHASNINNDTKTIITD